MTTITFCQVSVPEASSTVSATSTLVLGSDVGQQESPFSRDGGEKEDLLRIRNATLTQKSLAQTKPH